MSTPNKYSYNVITDFIVLTESKVDSDTLKAAIKNSALTISLNTGSEGQLEISGDNVDIWFSNALSGTEKTDILDLIIAAHTGIPIKLNRGIIVGESAGSVIISFNGSQKQIKMDGSGGAKETAGTVSITKGSTIVTGVKTVFTNLHPGDYIKLDTSYYEIDTINSNINLTVKSAYQGRTLSGISYIAQPMFGGVRISNVVDTGATTLEIISN